MKKDEKVASAIDNVLTLLANQPAAAITKVTFKKIAADKPMDSWSMLNQLSVISAYMAEHEDVDLETAIDKADFRGFKQWKEANRVVMKGQHSYAFIITPFFRKDKETDDKYLSGFGAASVFNADQTEGHPIETGEDERQKVVAQFNYLEVAKKLGIRVMTGPGNGRYYGSFSSTHNIIKLCTPDEATFYHELAHAVDNHLMIKSGGKGLKGGQHIDQEVVAQFTANVLAYMNDKEIETTTAYTKQYITGYAGKDAQKMVMSLIHRIEKIIQFVLENSNSQEAVSEPIAA